MGVTFHGWREFYASQRSRGVLDRQRPGFELFDSRGGLIVAFVANELGMFGSVGIIGLYVTILVTLGGVVRGYLLPQVTTLRKGWEGGMMGRYTTMPNTDLLLDLVHSLYVSRYGSYA